MPLRPAQSNAPTTAGAETLPETAHIQQQAQGLLQELTEASHAQSQISRAVALAFSAVTALLMVAYGLSSLEPVAAPTSWTARLGANPGAWLALGLGTAHLLACLWLLRKEALQPYTGRSLVLLNLPFYLASLWFLSGAPVLVLPVLAVWTHLLVAPREALWITGSMVGITGMAALTVFNAADQVSTARVLGGTVLIATLLHLMTLRARRTQDAARTVTHQLQGLTQRLGQDLLRTSAERDAARTVDAGTGLLNPQGLLELITRRLDTAPDAVWWLLTLRLVGLQDALAAANADSQQSLRRRLVTQLRHCAGTGGAVATDGRFEFSLLMPGQENDAAVMPSRFMQICQALMQPLDSEGALLLGQPIAGASRYPAPSRDAAQLVRHAEIALMHAAAIGATQPITFSEPLAAAVADRASLVEALQHALDHAGFELHYQPIVELATGRLHKAEALIRWVHPTRGRMSPALFIPLAEETGQIGPLTEWVLAQAAGQVREWRQSLQPDFQVSVNVPPAYLLAAARDPHDALRRLRALDLPQDGVVLEITEGALLRVDSALLDLLHHLRELGLRISLDDFGMGYSSFSQLDRLPLDFLKIDKAFVDEIESSPRKLAICDAVVRVGHALNLAVIAEGVQTPGQRELLHRTGCDYGQGFGFSPPLPANGLTALAQTLGLHGSIAMPYAVPASEGSSTR